MRVALVSLLVLVPLLVPLACGGAKKPAAAASDETASSEPSTSSSPDMASSEDKASSGDSKVDAKPHPAAAAAPASAAPPAAPAPPVHPIPAVTGLVDGKPFTPKLARVAAPMQKDGRILLSLGEATDCTTAPKPGEATLTMLVPWENGYKVDLAALKRGKRKGSGEITLSRGNGDVSATFKPSGRVTVVSAPMSEGAVGKMKIDLQSGDYMLAGDLDIQVCVAPK
jgi:hypothetical protein